MSVILGSGEHRYRVVENWAKLPDGWEFRDVAAVAVDSKDRVYVFNRGRHPMMVFDREGNFLRSWGEGLFGRAHGIHIDSDDTLYCTDDGDHTVRKCTTDGKVLLTGTTAGDTYRWDVSTGKAIEPPLKHPSLVKAVAYHPDGESFAVLYYRDGALIAVDAVNAPADYLVVRKALTMGKTLPADKAADPGIPLKSLLAG